MLDIGFWELLVVALVTLLVVGPDRLPGVARTAGMWARRIRRAVYTLRTQFERELDAEELRHTLNERSAHDPHAPAQQDAHNDAAASSDRADANPHDR